MLPLLISVTATMAAALLAARIVPPSAHGARRGILLAGFLASFFLPLLRWGTATWDVVLPVDTAYLTPASNSDPSPDSAPFWNLFFVVWAAGSLGFAFRAWRRCSAMKCLARCARPLDDEQTQLIKRVWRSSSGELPEIRTTDAVGSACVALSGCNTVILLPASAFAWPGASLRAVLRHEVEHVRRKDVWWRLAGEAALALWWCHPLMHLLLRRWTEVCEHVCDAAVLKSGVRPQRYARTLLALATAPPRPAEPALAFVGVAPSRLRRRVASILSPPAHGSVSASWLTWLAVTLLILAITAAAGLHFQHPKTTPESDLKVEAQLRLEANPFPADS